MRLPKTLRRKSRVEIALHLFVSFIFLLVAVSYVYLFVWAVLAGAKTHTEVIMNPFGLPKIWNWGHYLEVFSQLEINGNNFWAMLFNSVWFSVGGVGLQIFVTMNFAYCCTKYKFFGSEWAYTIIMIMLTLPIYGSAGAQYKLVYSMGLIDSYAQIVLSAAGFNILFLYFRAYFKNLSWSYAEAAMMDGANAFQIYFHVMAPMAKPIAGALFLTQWLTSWNSYSSALVYLPNLPTLPVGIYQFNIEMMYRARLDILFAGCVWISIPALILFIIFNKAITTNVTVGGLKG